MSRSALSLLPLAVLLVAVGGPARADEAAPAGETAQKCKVRSIVLLVAGEDVRETAELGYHVQQALSRYTCYKPRNVVETIEAGMAGGSALVETGRSELEAGHQEAVAMRLDAARPHFQAAVDAFGAGFSHIGYSGPFVDALMNLAVCEAVAGAEADAVRHFSDAIQLRADVNVDDFSTLPEATEAFEKARDARKAAGTGSLSIDSDPPNAEVFMDGRFLGIAPVDEPSVIAGNHWVVLRKAGYERSTIPISVKADQPTVVSLAASKMTPARRKPLYDKAVAKVSLTQPEAEDVSAVEDVKALFLSDLAMLVRIRRGASGGFTGHVSLWDLQTMTRLWTGHEPPTGESSELGRGAAEALVSSAIAVDEERMRVKESGAATIKPKGGGIVTKWWFWTAIGVVVVGGGTTAAVLLAKPKAGKPGLPHDGSGAVVVRF